MSIEPFAARLAELLKSGSIPASQLSKRARTELGPLFRTEVLTEERAGRGARVVVRDDPALRSWIARRFPSGLAPDLSGLPARAAALAHVAHSKRGERLAAEPLVLRGFRGASLTDGSDVLPLAELTGRFGLASVLLHDESPWRTTGTIAVVENLETFLHVEHIVPLVNVAVLAAGRLSARTIAWLAAQSDAEVMHMGDYDPVGLDEYLRLRAALGERVSLFVPDDLDTLVQRFGRADLLADSSTLLERVRARADTAVANVLGVLDKYGRGLEQESLLITLGDRCNDGDR